ncbi:ImcF-related family protein [Acerihabitans sp. TG2]|uniref:ImcF-related family protein n=1 Tax=Acerihabitans sp. TG2 TaxID=3096008 RepID=UPI002B23890A|nr:ImcF-related family protein [Acerihabitans sp. TG2]MEA9393061.1 ImcF-related family protein [Acerihabitans sp. TG2]
MKNPFSSRPSGASLLVMVFGAMLAAVLVFFGERWGVSPLLRSLIGATCMAVLFGGMAIYRNYRQQPRSQIPDTSLQKAPAEVALPFVQELRDYLNHHYGRFWRTKVRFVLLLGHSGVVEKAVPGLIGTQWLEANGVVALWGGNVTSAADSGRIMALRKLKRRPVDAMVLVYDGALRQATQGDTVARQLKERYKMLGWKVPLYLWEVQQTDWPQAGRETQPVGCLLPPRCTPDELVQALKGLPAQLTPQGVQQGLLNARFDFLLRLSEQLRTGTAEQFKTLCTPLLSGPYAVPLRGVMFSPVVVGEGADKQRWLPDNAWQAILDDLPSLRLQRVGFAWENSLYQAVLVLLGLTCAGLLFSYNLNRQAISEGQLLALAAADTRQPVDKRLMALDALQRRIEQLQYRSQQGTPWYSRFGLSQNDPLLAALWPAYARSAMPLLRDAAVAQLHHQLAAWNSLAPDSKQRGALSKEVYNQLKAYLMLNRPKKMDAPFFAATVMAVWPQREQVSPGLWQRQGASLLTFMAQNLPAHTAWQGVPDAQMAATTRSGLLRVIGMRNADAALYQKMLAQVARHYADMTLSDMTGDTDARKLFATGSVVPGMFTRQAWEQAVRPAIEKVANQRRDEIDWVLSDNTTPVTQDSSPEVLKSRLTERYFTDYAGAWLSFLNSLRWQRAATLSDAIDQLTLLAEVRQSPLVALMNTLNTQGRAGQEQESLSHTLVKSAQNLLHREPSQAIDQQSGPHGPLDAAFGPLLALMDNKGDSNNAMSLQTFLTRVTRVRLKLQQVTNTADPQAMMQALAQTVFQGKSVDVTDTRDYGSLVAASLGQEWSSFGQAVFVQPMDQAWQQVLSPTTQSINHQWQNAIVSDWAHDFNDRYPFAENKQGEASLPLLAQYLRNDTGRITQFVKSNLNGVLRQEGRHWVPDAIAAQGLHFNPAFLKALNQLSELSDMVFTSGDARVQFQLMGKPSRDVMKTHFILDQQTMDYHNQVERWQVFTWPDSQWKPRTTLSWVSVDAGERLYADYPGSWGFIRLLDKAQVTMVDNSTYKLLWKAPDGNLLNYMMRTDSGQGPLALLTLKGFRLPTQVFVEPGARVAADRAADHHGEPRWKS